jgi:putative hydrolase of the HAD superfamily
MAPAHEPRPQALLFDLGGVLIDIDFRRALTAWQRHSRLSAEVLASAFRFDDAYERHERGEIDAAEYFQHLAGLLHLDADHDSIAQGWNAIFQGTISEAVELVRVARAHVPCYAFTNTNAAHMAAWQARYPEVPAAFDGIFASHQLGRRKPEAAAFEVVIEAIGVPPGSIVFFDDVAENVDAARAAGLRAVQVRTPADIRPLVASLER